MPKINLSEEDFKDIEFLAWKLGCSVNDVIINLKDEKIKKLDNFINNYVLK